MSEGTPRAGAEEPATTLARELFPRRGMCTRYPGTRGRRCVKRHHEPWCCPHAPRAPQHAPPAAPAIFVELTQAVLQRLRDHLGQDVDGTTFPDMLAFEQWTDQFVRSTARAMATEFAEIRSQQAKEVCVKCSAWGRPLQRHRRSDWERHTPWGPIEIKDDGYYMCRHCTGTGTSARPLHWYLGTDRETWSLLLQEAAVDLATDESCQGAVDKLARHHPGVAMHRSTALRLLHHHGEQARAFVADKLKAALSEAAQEGQRRQTAVELEVEYDGGMIPVATLEPMPVEPGQEAETTPVRGAPKKRKTCRWEEVEVGLAQKPGEASRIYSVRPTGELDEAFRDLLAIACLQGWGEHTEVRGIADGAHYLRTRMEDTFHACPFRFILDRPHTKEHLSDVSKLLESKQLISVSAKQWYATAVRRLEHGDVDKLIGELGHAFDRSQDDDIRKQAEYFERNKDAVSYGDYRDHGWSTASSEVESAHRHVVQKRLKIPGAWWHPDNVRNILALRMLKANRWWDEYWELQRQQWRTRAQRLRNQRLPDNRNPDT